MPQSLHQHYSNVGDMLEKTQPAAIREKMDVVFADIEVMFILFVTLSLSQSVTLWRPLCPLSITCNANHLLTHQQLAAKKELLEAKIAQLSLNDGDTVPSIDAPSLPFGVLDMEDAQVRRMHLLWQISATLSHC